MSPAYYLLVDHKRTLVVASRFVKRGFSSAAVPRAHTSDAFFLRQVSEVDSYPSISVKCSGVTKHNARISIRKSLPTGFHCLSPSPFLSLSLSPPLPTPHPSLSLPAMGGLLPDPPWRTEMR